jgi:hypothetical protein
MIYDIMPFTDRKLELKAKTSMAQTASQVAVYAKGLMPLSKVEVTVSAIRIISPKKKLILWRGCQKLQTYNVCKSKECGILV